MVLLDGTAIHPRQLLGNKGHGIEAMRRHGLAVPPAFCITTEVGLRYLGDPRATMDAVWDDVLDRMRWLEAETRARSGGARVPCWSVCARGPPSPCPG